MIILVMLKESDHIPFNWQEVLLDVTSDRRGEEEKLRPAGH
jgi:hypothetical protein